MNIDENNVAAILAALRQKTQPSCTETTSSTPGPARTAGVSGSVGAAGDRLHDSISDLLAADPQEVAAKDALTLLQTVVRERHRLDAAYLRAVALADQLDAATEAGASSIQGYLKASLGVSPGRAKADLAAAHAIHGTRSKELIPTAEVDTGTLAPLGRLLSEGAVSLAHLDVGVKTLEKVPARLINPENLERITGFLAAHAPSITAQETRVLGDRLIRSLEPERDDHYDPEAFNRRFFTMATDITGMVHGHYQLDPAAGADLRSILEPLSAPKPDQTDDDGEILARDTRTPDQRRADALGELIHAANTLLGTTPDTKTGTGAAGAAGAAGTAGAAGVAGQAETGAGTGTGFGAGPEAATGFGAGTEAATAGSGAGAQPGLFELAGTSDGSFQSRAGKLRLSRRQNRITIVTSMDQIQTLRARHADQPLAGAEAEREKYLPVDPTPSYCDHIGPITAGTLARMSCDGLFERVILNAKGAVLDLGMTTRLATPAQRRALIARDHGCIVPGCDRPPSWCEAHHIIWYSHNGETNINNLALFCGSDHSRAHTGQLEAKMIDGIPYIRFLHPNSSINPTIPKGSISHPTQADWIRNGYFDRLKSADNAARAILIPTNDPRLNK